MKENRRELKDQALYNKISEDYCQKDTLKYSSLCRQYRLNQTIKNCKTPIDTVLELGCGGGFTAKYIQDKYIKYLGVDYSKKLIQFAQKNNSVKGKANFICENIKNLTPKNKYDLILMIGVLHHATDIEDLLQKLKTFLKPGSKLIVNEPQRGNPIITILRKARKLIDKTYSEDQLFFSRKELINIFHRSGYTVNTYPQGIFSTIFAESTFFPPKLILPIAKLSIIIDPIIEKIIQKTPFRVFSWNIVVEATAN